MSLSLLELGLVLTGVKTELSRSKILERTCVLLENPAKDALGTYEFGWPPLAPETIASKATGDSPLLETGELRDSIHHVSGREGGQAVGYVGTNDPVAKYHELGTRTIPPRSFLGEAAMRQEHKIHRMMERTIAATFDRGGPRYRELRELFHVLHMAYEETKKLADEFLDEDEQ
jgi:phage gpG-like protein